MKNADDFLFKKAEQEWLTPPEENKHDGGRKISFKEHSINKNYTKNK